MSERRRRGPNRVVLFALVAAACAREPANETAPVDIADAADRAQESVDSYATRPRDRPASPPAVATPAPAPSPTPTAPGPDNVVDEAPFTPDSAQGAADVIQTYYALIEAGRYRQAWRLWDDDGRASGMSADAFAASFAKYREYHATVGAPGRIDAGAGQRYVTVPVEVYGRLRDGGGRFTMQGPMTLHRTADIDGATAAQRSWRISESGVRPTATKARAIP